MQYFCFKNVYASCRIVLFSIESIDTLDSKALKSAQIARFGFNSTLYYSSKFYLVYISMKNMKNKHFLGHKIEFHRWIHLAQQQPI